MNRWYIPRNSSVLLVLVVVALGLTACGPGTLVVGLEPTPTLTPVPTPVVRSYVSDAFGFRFRYPETWTLAEKPQAITLSRGDLALTIAYGWASQPGFRPLGGRTGMPAGDFIYAGKISFLEQSIPVRVLEYERRDKMVLYGDASLVEAGGLAFSIWLDERDGATSTELDIPEQLQEEAKEILASFERVEAAGEPPVSTSTPVPTGEEAPASGEEDALSIYVNDEYQFAFTYPSSWELEEVPSGQEIPGGASASAVHLTQETLRLAIQFKRLGEDVVLGASGLPAGEIEEGDTITVLGREVPKQLVVYEGKVKSVFLRERFDDLALYVQLDGKVGGDAPYEAVDVPASAQSALDAILGNLHRTGELKSFSPDTLAYENTSHGFAFEYPASWTLQEVAGEVAEDGVRLADAVILRQGTFAIVLQYRLKSDPAQAAWGGSFVPGGLGYAEATLGERVTILGEEAYKHIWAYDGAVKAVAVNTTGRTADLLLSITLADGSVRVIQPAEAATIPDGAIAALDQVLASLVLTQ